MLALTQCVVPPSFDGYEAEGGAAGSAGAAGSGGVAGTAGSAALDAGSDAETGDASWGHHCQANRDCAAGLHCISEQPGIDGFALGFGLNAPMCASACDPEAGFCTGPGGEDGLCLGFGSTGSCIPLCDVQLPGLRCPDGSRCMHEFPEEGFGICTIPCRTNADCSWTNDVVACRSDGMCDDSANPTPLDDCSVAACSCYPNLFAETGTCRIPCGNDSECPVHSPSGQAMFCPEDSGNQPAYSFCTIACDNPGASDPTCDPLDLLCRSFGGRDGCVDPDLVE